MANWQSIQSEIVTVLQGISNIQEVHNYEKSSFRGFPACTVTPSDKESDFEATQERERVYAYRVRLYMEFGSDQHPVTGEGTKEADRILRDTVDAVVDEFDKPTNARFSGNADTTASKVLFVEPVPSTWAYDTARNMRVTEIVLRCHVYVDTNQL